MNFEEQRLDDRIERATRKVWREEKKKVAEKAERRYASWRDNLEGCIVLWVASLALTGIITLICVAITGAAFALITLVCPVVTFSILLSVFHLKLKGFRETLREIELEEQMEKYEGRDEEDAEDDADEDDEYENAPETGE